MTAVPPAGHEVSQYTLRQQFSPTTTLCKNFCCEHRVTHAVYLGKTNGERRRFHIRDRGDAMGDSVARHDLQRCLPAEVPDFADIWSTRLTSARPSSGAPAGTSEVSSPRVLKYILLVTDQ